jgi:DNA-binding XRE family transcriptional regulator
VACASYKATFSKVKVDIMTDKIKTYDSIDEWLGANPLYKWRGKPAAPRSMRAAALEIGVSQQAVMFWERGENDAMPKHRYMVRMAALMNLSTATLYTKWQAWLNAKPAETQQPALVAV